MELSLSTVLLLVISSAVMTFSEDSPMLVIYLTDQGFRNGLGAVYETNTYHFNFTALPLQNVSKPRSIDYDMKGEHIYWTDAQFRQIKRASRDGRDETVVAQLNETASPDGLTLDGITRQIFYTDSKNDVIVRIEMADFKSTVIVKTELANPKGIVADTRNRKLYWVDWGTEEKIESCDYGGGQRRTVVKRGVVSPNGITLDEQAGRLYWADGVGTIDTILVDGTDRRRVYTEHGVIFNDIIFYNSFLYMTMLNYPFIVAMPEDGSSLMILHFRRFRYPFGLHVFSPNVTSQNTCLYGEFGDKCQKCGRCIDGDYCEKTTGLCLAGCAPGYQGDRCMRKCDSFTFGEECKSKCGKCKVGSVCHHVTGKCPSGCESGYRGDGCTEVCGAKTFGDPCEDCGYCARGATCDGDTGECPGGCLEGWYGKQCKSDSAPTTPRTAAEETPIGLIVGLAVGVTLVIIVVVVIVAVIIVRRQGKAADPDTYVELDEPQSKDNDYSTLGGISNAGIMLDSEQPAQSSTTGYDNVMVSPVWDSQNEGDPELSKY